MKRRGLLLVGLLAAMTACLVFAGCSQNRLTEDDLIEMGYVHRVTFDLMGGKSGERTELIQQVKDESLVVEPGTTTLAGEAPTKEGYTFNAYWTGTKDEDGNVSFLREWDFATDRVTEDITLYARWLTNYSITVHYGQDYNYTKTYTVPVTQTSEGVAQQVNSIAISGQTVLGGAFYLTQEDAAAETDPVTFPYTPADLSQDKTTTELWANTLEGDWRIVETAADFIVRTGTNIYLTADIDFGGAALEFPETYSGTFEGNGHTLSNFTVTQERGLDRTQSYGLFRELRGDAVIRNVTFKDVTFTAMLTNSTVTEYRMGLLAGSSSTAARVSGVTFEGGSFTFVVDEKFIDELDERAFVGGAVSPDVVDTASCTISDSTLVRKVTTDEWNQENAE